MLDMAARPIGTLGTGTRSTGRRGRVLIVEDDDDLRALVETLLAEEGYDALGVPDGAAGLALIEAAPPDLVLLDLHTPGLPSDAFARGYRARAGPTARLIVVSGDDGAALSQAARALGAEASLVKPFDVDALLDLVNRHFNTSPA